MFSDLMQQLRDNVEVAKRNPANNQQRMSDQEFRLVLIILAFALLFGIVMVYINS